MRTDYDAVLTDLERQRADLDAAIAALRRLNGNSTSTKKLASSAKYDPPNSLLRDP